MRNRRFVAALAVVFVGASVGCAPDPGPTIPPEPIPIGANQQFSGLVNWTEDDATVFTLCAIGATRGHPVPFQPLSVKLDPDGDGNTGTHSSVIYAQPDAYYQVEQITHYGKLSYLSADLDVPCNGEGTITFHQCWGIIACLDGSPDVVKVRFDSIGVPFDPPPPADDGPSA